MYLRKLTSRDEGAGRQVYVESATGRVSWNPPMMSPTRPPGPQRAHPATAHRMSMPVNPVSRPMPPQAGARPVRPAPMHGRAPSMQVQGTRVPSGARPPTRAFSGSISVSNPSAMRPSVPSQSTSGPTSPMLGATARPMRPGAPPLRPGAPGRPGHAASASVSTPVSPGAATRPPRPTVRPTSARPALASRPPPGPRRRAYPTAHIAAHSISYSGGYNDVPMMGQEPSSTFTPATVGHMPTRSVSAVHTPTRTISAGHAPMPSAAPATASFAVPEGTLVPADMAGGTPLSAQAATPAAAPAPAPAPAPSVNTMTEQMQHMQVSQPPRMGNQVQNTVVGAQPPVMSELEAQPPPICLPAGATVTPSLKCNADPSYQRVTLTAVPSTHALATKSKLPLAVILSPMRSVRPEEGDEPVPLVTDSVIARCRRCRTYINPFVTFVENGSRWKCPMCLISNEVPQLFDWDQETNQPADRWKRPELNSGVVEFVAPREYMVRPPQPPVYVFVMDVTFAAVSSGMISTAASTILNALDSMPNKDDRAKVAFIGFDSQLHFFRLVPGQTEPSLLVVTDLDDVFLPQPNDLLVSLTECRSSIEGLLRGLANMYKQAVASPSALGAALQAAFKLISGSGGKIEVFTASLPSVGPGALKMRDDKKLYGGPREATLLTPGSPFYKTFPIECSRSQVSVDMWLFGPAYIDVATLSCLPRYTGGQTFYYPTYDLQHPENARKFAHELHQVLTSPISYEAVLRLRASRGIRTTSFHGNFFVRSSDLLALPSVPSDQGYMIECEVDEPLHVPYAVFQSVVLHSTSDGERRIRVMTTAVPTTSSLSEVYASADQVAIAGYLARKAVEKCITSRLDDARGLLRSRLTDILQAYRSTMTNTRGGNTAHLTLCHNLSLLPLLVLGLLRNRGFRMGMQIPIDVRAYNHTLLQTLPLERLVPFLLPVLYSLHNMPADAGTMDPTTQTLIMPPRLTLTSERFERHGLYLIEDGMSTFLWLGRAAVPALTMDVFGAQDYQALQSGPVTLPALDNAMSKRVRAIVERVGTQRRGPYMSNVYIVKEDGDPGMRLLALSRMIEDRYEQTSGYLQFLGQLRDKINGT